jgi:Fe-S-cluster containining protein
MTQQLNISQSVKRISENETFTFSCHKDVKCFTDCCRMLELALTPYDVLRLRQATGLTSSQLLDRYVIIEQDPGEPFPRFYLTMVDDGRASCVFVTARGCSVYEHRPAACRAYPLGRAVMMSENGSIAEHFVLLKEDHCHGFQEPNEQTALQYSEGQELLAYNRFNDAVAAIYQHDSIRKGFIPTSKQIDLFILALYNIDSFREMLLSGKLLSLASPTPADKIHLMSDEALLLFAIDWLARQLFEPF